MTKDNYEVLVDTAIQSATVLDHSKSPCEETFIPETKVRKIDTGVRKSRPYLDILVIETFVMKEYSWMCVGR